MGAKIWWRWLKNPTAAWAQLWKRKYAPFTPEDQLIRHNTQIQGSHIWNTAWQNRTLVQEHAFWEIRDGGSALFWQDSWQQLKPLDAMEELSDLKQASTGNNALKVRHLWKPQTQHSEMATMEASHQELEIPENLNLQGWQTQAKRRKILTREGPDILRWGYSTAGIFNIKEAYLLQGQHQEQRKEHIWSKVWNPALWPKVSTFLWLVVHNRALTWDNLRKRGFIGPSICALCHQQEETKEHLFNGCHYSQQIWDQGAQAMRRSNQDRSSINDTIENWDHSTYNNPILNLIWQLLSGFILWQIWKERNKRIFHSQPTPPETTWETIRSLIKETIRSKSWTEEDLQCSPEERCTCKTGSPSSTNNWGQNLLRIH
jgi:hypothetical protein